MGPSRKASRTSRSRLQVKPIIFSSMNFDHLIETLRGLPEPVIEQVHEYVEFLSTKHRNKVEEEENCFGT